MFVDIPTQITVNYSNNIKMVRLITYIYQNEYDCGCKQTRHYWEK